MRVDAHCPVLVSSGAKDPVCSPRFTDELIALFRPSTRAWVQHLALVNLLQTGRGIDLEPKGLPCH